jgi:Fe-S oxidoreductase
MEDWVDLYPAQMNQICCGGGGGAMTTGYDKERIFYARRKIDQIKASGADMVVVPCHSCHGQLKNIKTEYGMKDLEIKYLWELVAECLVR